jgi:hypothetical protein
LNIYKAWEGVNATIKGAAPGIGKNIAIIFKLNGYDKMVRYFEFAITVQDTYSSFKDMTENVNKINKLKWYKPNLDTRFVLVIDDFWNQIKSADQIIIAPEKRQPAILTEPQWKIQSGGVQPN